MGEKRVEKALTDPQSSCCIVRKDGIEFQKRVSVHKHSVSLGRVSNNLPSESAEAKGKEANFL